MQQPGFCSIYPWQETPSILGRHFDTLPRDYDASQNALSGTEQSSLTPMLQSAPACSVAELAQDHNSCSALGVFWVSRRIPDHSLPAFFLDFLSFSPVVLCKNTRPPSLGILTRVPFDVINSLGFTFGEGRSFSWKSCRLPGSSRESCSSLHALRGEFGRLSAASL